MKTNYERCKELLKEIKEHEEALAKAKYIFGRLSKDLSSDELTDLTGE